MAQLPLAIPVTRGPSLEDPLITPVTPNERIGLILVCNGINGEQIRLIGDTAAERLPFGLTPSDHTRVVASLEIRPMADDIGAGSRAAPMGNGAQENTLESSSRASRCQALRA